MSKPTRPGELQNSEVNTISLVAKAANGEKFKIFKSAEDEGQQVNPEAISKDEHGFFTLVKNFFTGEKVEKGAVADIVNANENGKKLFEAFEALMKVLGLSRWKDEPQTPETDPAKIMAAIDDFRDLSITILLGNNKPVEKSGRKISSARLSKLKDMKILIDEILSDVQENEQEEETVTKEEVTKAVAEAIKPFAERIEKLEKPEKSEPPAEDIIKNAVSEAVKPLTERLEKVEKARGMSNKLLEDSAVEKSGDNFWGNIF